MVFFNSATDTLYHVAYGATGKKTNAPLYNSAADQIIRSQKMTVLLGTVFLVTASVITALGISLALVYSFSPTHVVSPLANHIVHMGISLTALGILFLGIGSYFFYKGSRALYRYTAYPLSENLQLLGKDLYELQRYFAKSPDKENLLQGWDSLYNAYAPALSIPYSSGAETLKGVAYETVDGKIKIKNPAAAKIITQHLNIICVGKIIACVGLFFVSVGFTSALVFYLASHLNALSLAQAGGCLGLAGCFPLLAGGVFWYRSGRALKDYNTKPMQDTIDRIGQDLLKIGSKDAFEAAAIGEGRKIISQALQFEEEDSV